MHPNTTAKFVLQSSLGQKMPENCKQHSMGSRNSGNSDSKSNDNLNCVPRDIIYEILTRVPAEALVRFKVVCKLWKTIISNPKFIRSHLHIWESKPAVMVTDLTSNCLLLSDLQERDSTNFLIPFPKGYSNILASTDGLLLLEAIPCYSPHVGYEKMKLCVHNPVTGSQKLLPSNPKSLIGGIFLIVHDASIQKYKVVVFIDDNINIITIDNDGDRGSVWRELSSTSTFSFCMKDVFKPITVNGILHWLSYSYDIEILYPQVAFLTSLKKKKVVTFVQSMDIATEEFRPGISLPCQPKTDSDDDDELINCNLLVMKGSIYFSNPATDMELELWMLVDLGNHTWVKKWKICLLSMVGKPNGLSSFLVGGSFYPIQMIGNHGLMIIRHDSIDMDDDMDFLDGRDWYLYNVRSQELKAIFGGTTRVKECYYLRSQQITHVKSLVGWN